MLWLKFDQAVSKINIQPEELRPDSLPLVEVVKIKLQGLLFYNWKHVVLFIDSSYREQLPFVLFIFYGDIQCSGYTTDIQSVDLNFLFFDILNQEMHDFIWASWVMS